METGQILIVFIIGLAIFIGIFILLREFNCWYWKINKRLEIQQKQLDVLLNINKMLDYQIKKGDTPKPTQSQE